MTQELEYEITHRYAGVDIQDSEFESLLAAASWKQTPTFLRRGRVARQILKQPAILKDQPERQLTVAKLKGVGVYDPASLGHYRDRILGNYSDEPQPPTTKPLESFVTYPHVGINKEGEYALVYGALAPIGGIVYERGLNEYRNAQTLYENNIPTIIPLVVIQYKDLEFRGEPMGAVITLSSEPAPYRLSEVQYLAATQRGKNKEADAYYDHVCASLGIEGDPAKESVRMQAVNTLARQIGKIMHDFSVAGLYRYSPEWSNIEYDFSQKTAFLTDLDSVRELNELSAEQQRLQVLRDLGSLVYRLVGKFGTPSSLDHYTLKNLLEYDPLSECLIGYFPNAHEEQIRQISGKLWNAFVPYLFLLKKHRKAIQSSWSSEQRRSYKMEHDLFYILAITSLYPIFQDSDLARQYPSSLTQEQLMQMAKRYLGERYEYFEYLLN
ncbi:MAG: SET domain-containing protein [Pseudomonadota bacterium]